MRSKAPDTRGKLDSNRDLNKAPKKKITLFKREEVESTTKAPKKTSSIKQIKEKIYKDHTVSNVKIKIAPKESNGQIFKKTHGYSKSMKRAMNNAGVVSLEAYRPIRKARKKAVKKVQQDKRSLSKAKRSAGSDKKGKKK